MYELLNILLGAGVISVIVNALLTSFREARERKRERRGLLRLLLAEFRGNNRSVELMLHNPEFITYSPDEAFVDEAWKQSRVRLAQLLPYSEDFDLFSAYYENQGVAKGLSKRWAEQGWHVGFHTYNPALADFIEQLQLLQRYGRAAEGAILRYGVSTALEYSETLDEITQQVEGSRPQEEEEPGSTRRSGPSPEGDQ